MVNTGSANVLLIFIIVFTPETTAKIEVAKNGTLQML